MKILATTLLLTSLFCLPSHLAFASEVNSSWTTLGQAKVEKIKRHATLPFRPELSIEENNARNEAFRSRSVAVIASVAAESRQNWNLINRSVRFQSGNHWLQGRITAIMISPDSAVTVFAQLDDAEGVIRLQRAEEISGVLSIGE